MLKSRALFFYFSHFHSVVVCVYRRLKIADEAKYIQETRDNNYGFFSLHTYQQLQALLSLKMLKSRALFFYFSHFHAVIVCVCRRFKIADEAKYIMIRKMQKYVFLILTNSYWFDYHEPIASTQKHY